MAGPRSSTMASTWPTSGFGGQKADYDLFLGRLHRAKGIPGQSRAPGDRGAGCVLAGGWRRSFRRGIRFVGHVGGEGKARLLAEAPLSVDARPLGRALRVDAHRGAGQRDTGAGHLAGRVAGVVVTRVGALGDTVESWWRSGRPLDEIDPGACRAHVERHFTPPPDGRRVRQDVPGVPGDGERCRRDGRSTAGGGRSLPRHYPAVSTGAGPTDACSSDARRCM